jgi:lipoate-protein ligase A
MTKEEIANLIDQMPQDMDVNDFIHELVNRALAVKREWVGLTDEEIKQCVDSRDGFVEDFARVIEAKLKEKNT